MNKVFLITSHFPYGEGEEFIISELEAVKALNVTIEIFPLFYTSGKIKKIPDTVVVNKNIFKKPNIFTKCVYCTAFVIRKEFYAEIRNLVKSKKFSFRNIKKLLSFGTNGLNVYYSLKRYINNNKLIYDGNNIFYSYWMTYSAYALALIGIEYGFKCVARAHGGDLYEERNNGYIPLREFICDNLNGIYPCSKNGELYLKNRFGNNNIITYKYLGTVNNNKFSSALRNKVFRIVSCSYVVPVKRVYCIAEALKNINTKNTAFDSIEWIHIGDGPDMPKIQNVANKINSFVKPIFIGRVDNANVLKYYSNNYVNLFVNVSESEGLPVSIMEAMSFGIPIIATDVGGVSEIVDNNVNGFLLDKEFKVQELTNLIEKFMGYDIDTENAFRKNAYNKWKDNFNAEHNYKMFYGELLEL